MLSNAIALYCDNYAIVLAKKHKSHPTSKHIKWQFHILHDYLEKKYIEVKRVDSTYVMDLLTEPLSQQKTKAHHEKCNLCL